MSDKKRELTEEELKKAAGGADGAGDIRSTDAADSTGDLGSAPCDDNPATDDCASSETPRRDGQADSGFSIG